MNTGRILPMLLWLTASLSVCSAFSTHMPQLSSVSSTVLHAGGGLFGGMFGGDQNKNEGPTTVFEVPAKNVKIGALRFFLQIYLVGECNKPEQGSWFAKQNDDGGLDMYYKDATGMCSIDMTEYAITVKRHGQKPSLQYMLQESVMLHGLLDELNTLAFEVDDIDEDKRLLQLNDPGDAIDIARSQLPAGRGEKDTAGTD